MAPALLARIDVALALLGDLRREVAALPNAATDELLTATESLERFGIGRDGLLAAERRGELALTRGPRNRIQVSRSALEAYQRRPHAPTKGRSTLAPQASASLEAWDEQAGAELRLLAGGRR
jgi:hypothetical protein